jgi:hypothetical protein
MTTKTSDAASGRTTPTRNGQKEDKNLLAGVLFDEDATEVKAVEGIGKGKAPNPMNPVVVTALDAMLALKLDPEAKKSAKARYEGTNFTVRSVLKSTAQKWETKANKDGLAPEGFTIKVKFDTLTTSPSKPSPDKDDNDKPVHMGYRLEFVPVPKEDTETVSA